MCVCVAHVVFETSQIVEENDKNVNYQVLDFVHTIPVHCYYLTRFSSSMVNCFKFTKRSVKVDSKLVAIVLETTITYCNSLWFSRDGLRTPCLSNKQYLAF